MLKYVIPTIVTMLLMSTSAGATQKLISTHTTKPPVIDGIDDDIAWKSSPTITTQDVVANIPIEIQSIYTTKNIFIKIRFPDTTENRSHKMLDWDKSIEEYRTGPLREDTFVVKWSMEPVPVDLSLTSDVEYRADIWFWKAFRTDPMGYADDKMHIFSSVKGKKSQNIILPNGKVMFLSRPSDSGKSTYKSIAYEKYSGESVPRYEHRQPTESRADVKAKGVWADGFWTIEFQRDLTTENKDDVQFHINTPSFFGVSRHEIGGKAPNPKLEQPNYESGEISELIQLIFKQ